MMTAVHSGTVTPVVSWPTESVIVLPPFCSASSIAVAHLVQRFADDSRVGVVFATVASGQDHLVVLEDLVPLQEPLESLR